jgi:hypothetical protein
VATGENEDQRPARHGVDGDAVLLGSDPSRSPERHRHHPVSHAGGHRRGTRRRKAPRHTAEEDFHRSFDSQQDMQQVMADTGVNGPPVTTSYRILSTPDRF